MRAETLPLDSFLSHLDALPDRLRARAPGSAAVPVPAWHAAQAPDLPLAEALARDLGEPWESYDALSPTARRVATFLATQPEGAWREGLRRLAGDLAAGRDATPDETAAARTACATVARRHAYVATVFQAQFALHAGKPLPAWAFVGLAGSEPGLYALALDVGRRTRLPRALAAHFHHRLEVELGEPHTAPRFEGLAALLAGPDGAAA